MNACGMTAIPNILRLNLDLRKTAVSHEETVLPNGLNILLVFIFANYHRLLLGRFGAVARMLLSGIREKHIEFTNVPGIRLTPSGNLAKKPQLGEAKCAFAAVQGKAPRRGIAILVFPLWFLI